MKIKADNDIILQQVRIKSAREIFDCMDRSRAFLSQWLPFVDTTKSYKDTEAFLRTLHHERAAKKNLVFEIRHRDKLAGIIGMKDIDLVNNKAEIGYWLGKEFVGKGIVTRSCVALINFAYDELKINRLEIKCAVENVRSCNIPKQLGFTFEGIERQAEYIHRRYQDLKVYSLLRKEWNAK